jgi:hypothetical protein
VLTEGSAINDTAAAITADNPAIRYARPSNRHRGVSSARKRVGGRIVLSSIAGSDSSIATCSSVGGPESSFRISHGTLSRFYQRSSAFASRASHFLP